MQEDGSSIYLHNTRGKVGEFTVPTLKSYPLPVVHFGLLNVYVVVGDPGDVVVTIATALDPQVACFIRVGYSRRSGTLCSICPSLKDSSCSENERFVRVTSERHDNRPRGQGGGWGRRIGLICIA